MWLAFRERWTRPGGDSDLYPNTSTNQYHTKTKYHSPVLLPHPPIISTRWRNKPSATYCHRWKPVFWIRIHIIKRIRIQFRLKIHILREKNKQDKWSNPFTNVATNFDKFKEQQHIFYFFNPYFCSSSSVYTLQDPVIFLWVLFSSWIRIQEVSHNADTDPERCFLNLDHNVSVKIALWANPAITG